MAQPFDPGTDFALIAADLAFTGNVTVREMNVDTGNVTTSVANVPALGRTTDAVPVGVAPDGSVIPLGKTFWLSAGCLSWALKVRDEVVDSGVAREIGALSLVAFDKLYRVDTHYVVGG